MSTSRSKAAAGSRNPRRSFTWEIRSSDIRFTPPGEGLAANDGCNCSDCSAASPLERPRPIKPARRTGR